MLNKYLIFLLFCSLNLISCQTPPSDDRSGYMASDTTRPISTNPVTDTLTNDNIVRGNIVWQEINTFDSSIAYSKIARLGKISVFLLSTPWCGPCKILQDSLSQHGVYAEQVDFYYVNMSFNRPYRELKETDAYFYARMYDRLKEWPRVVITSPSASIIKSFSQEDLYRECLEREIYNQLFLSAPDSLQSISILKESALATCDTIGVYHKTLEIVERLIKFKDKFHLDKVIQMQSEQKTGK